MIDLRQHVASLIAVFLALGLGVMLGGSQLTPQKYEQMLLRVEDAQEQLRRENDLTREESARVRRVVQHRDSTLKAMLPLVLRNQLPSGARVALIWCGDWESRPFRSDLEGALRAAGGQVLSVTIVPDELAALSPDARAGAFDRWGERATSVGGKFEALRWFVRGMIEGGAGRQLEELGRDLGLQLEGDYDSSCRRFLLLCTANRPERQQRAAAADVPEIPLVDAGMELGVRVVAAEPEGLEASIVRALGARGVPTVDNVDTPAGQISAVLCLAGQDGQFGSKPGAAAPLPPLSLPQ